LATRAGDKKARKWWVDRKIFSTSTTSSGHVRSGLLDGRAVHGNGFAGPQRVTDAWLPAFAVSHDGRRATFRLCDEGGLASAGADKISPGVCYPRLVR